MNASIVLFIVLAATLTNAVPNPAIREISHEDIREAIMQLVHMVRDSGDKLERHEYRERQLGEQLKKALGGLDKRHRASDSSVETINKALVRLEDKLRTVENMITQRDERERIQLQKTQNIMEGIEGSLSTWMKNMEDVVRTTTGDATGKSTRSPEALEAGLNSRIDGIAATLERLESTVLKSNYGTLNKETENLRAATAKLSSTDAKVRQSATETERVLSQYEARLGELTGTAIDVRSSNSVQDWHPIFLNALENHQKVLNELKQMTQSATKELSEMPRKSDLKRLTNSTHDLLQEIKYQLDASAEKGVAKLEGKLSDAQSSLGKGQDEMLKTITEASIMTDTLYSDVTKSYDQLLKEVQGLAKVEQVMIQTADNVMDTKRRVEYGVHQILLEVGDLVKLQSKDLNSTINRRFDNISATILDNQTGALSNLSSKIETEISQVWRQIGIMYQQLTASAGVLDHLQHQTDIYVNGSLATMDSMQGKVGQITGRMGEVDENLNYLLGRLSLVTQEFNMIKEGLGTALDNIRSSFLTVQDKIKDVGPGPNPIPDNDVTPPLRENDEENQVSTLDVEPQ